MIISNATNTGVTNMSNRANSTKKKRNKRYTGEGAATQGVHVTRVTAVKKNPIQQFWIDKKVQIIGLSVISGVLLVVGYGVFALVTWIF